MLSDHFFRIVSTEILEPKHFRVLVELIPEHPVYSGHFPGNPVVPGVCSLQMVIECVGRIMGYPVSLSQAPVVKFLGIIQPSSDSELTIDIMIDDADKVKATIASGERTVMSCKLKLTKLISSIDSGTGLK